MMFARMINRARARFYANPIIRYLNSHDYRVGIKAYKTSEHSSTYKIGAEVQAFLASLISTFNDATEAEKMEFLQHEESQDKLFAIIAGLFLHHSRGWSNALPFSSFESLLGVLALNPDTERRFYHSHHFLYIAPYSKYDVFIDINHPIEARDLARAAIQKYPDVLMALLSQYFPIELSKRAYLLDSLKKTPAYLDGRLASQDILAYVPKANKCEQYFRCNAYRVKDIAFYARALVPFTKEPDQLFAYITDDNSSERAAIQTVIAMETERRAFCALLLFKYNISSPFSVLELLLHVGRFLLSEQVILEISTSRPTMRLHSLFVRPRAVLRDAPVEERSECEMSLL